MTERQVTALVYCWILPLATEDRKREQQSIKVMRVKHRKSDVYCHEANIRGG